MSDKTFEGAIFELRSEEQEEVSEFNKRGKIFQGIGIYKKKKY